MIKAFNNLRGIKVQINYKKLNKQLSLVEERYKEELEILKDMNWQYVDATEFEINTFLAELLNEYPEVENYIGSVLTGKVDLRNDQVIDYLCKVFRGKKKLVEVLEHLKMINKCINGKEYYEKLEKNTNKYLCYNLNIFSVSTVGIVDRTNIKDRDKDYVDFILTYYGEIIKDNDIVDIKKEKFSFKEIYYKAVLKELGIEYKKMKKGLLTDELTQSEEIELIPLIMTGYINSKLIDKLIEHQVKGVNTFQGYIFEKIFDEISEYIESLRQEGYKEINLTNYEIFMVKG